MLYGGYTGEEMEKEIEEKARVLRWMAANKITDVDTCGYLVSTYYNKKESILNLVENNTPFTEQVYDKLKQGEI